MPEDYLLRLARQISQLLKNVLVLRREGRKEEAQAEVARLSLESIGLPWRTVRQSSPEALLQHVEGAGALRHHRATLLAELLVQEGEMAAADGRAQDAIRAKLQAFCLIASVRPMFSEEDLAHYDPVLDGLARELEPLSQHPYLKEKLAAYRAVRP